jgi:outer membrane protein assembly factor BamE (lipoprotein component of BamABCDE complex)
MTTHLLARLLLLFSVVLLGWGTVNAAEQAGPIKTPKSRIQFGWEMDVAKQDQLFAKLALLKLGNTRDLVIDSLGKPTTDRVLTPKAKRTFLVRRVDYYVKRVNANVNTNDQIVTLDFDQADALIEVKSNVDGHVISITEGSYPPGTVIGTLMNVVPK